MIHIERILQNCSEDHLLKVLFQHKNDYLFSSSFLWHLNNTLSLLLEVDLKAYNDFIFNKLPAKNRDSFDIHSYISSLCELAVMYSFLNIDGKIEFFMYEPCLRDDNKKNVEFSIKINSIIYNVEVKAPNLEAHYKTISDKIDQYGVVIRLDSRGIKRPNNENEIPSPTMRVKDFLVDANQKFPQRSEGGSFNILFIAWDENTDQPCIALKEPRHGLLVKNSEFRDVDGSAFIFENIDLIFVSDLYKNFIVHIASTNKPLLGFIADVPYFDNALKRVHPFEVNPFILSFSRNLVVSANCDLQDRHVQDSIYQLPIAFSSQDVFIVDEDFVTKNCAGVKFSFG